jgi:hypothetical protein
MGHAAENPSALPLVLLHDFYFVRAKHTEISITFGDRLHRHDLLPIRMDGSKMTFLRYSPDLYVASVNPAFEGTLEPITVKKVWNTIEEESLIEITTQDGLPAISGLRRNHRNHELNMRFEPAFPDISAMKSHTTAKGRFKIAGHPGTGTVEGVYSVEKNEFETHITLIPSKGWKPRPDRFSLRFLYRVAKVFRHWPKTYIWEATIVEDDGSFYMKSDWKRTGR